ncbi:hypothetical protein M409DRAFT_68192 [Zasmidium cellare ATCC 36951]|uniref:Zn(2)-C6 fungal-type domain-containing protein n=1 Tax=Zasmidium cellare ATCC 36951 TaxID=1080233 RepID=A0A6A6CEU1_ZASCE|nr:uncharacterized protein M409DRAFT_68192 [Zasmidium cellare ATCC 36951]KAF2163946.1 hypothetical protein M409DRAFT_68192 [Zasmidium cellare ATCC 36951]
MDGQYGPPIPPLGGFYPNGYPPMMTTEPLHPPRTLQQLQTLSMESLGTYSDYDDPNRSMPPPHGLPQQPQPPQQAQQQASQRSRRRQPTGSDHVKHRRTRSGCYTCRQRRVKCDETHPVCDRCRKGKRECTYPGTTASTPKPSRSTSKSKGSPDGSSLSESDIEPDSALPLSAIPDDEDEDAAGEDDPQATTPESRKPSESSSSLIDKSTSPSTEASATAMRSTRPQPARTSSKQSIKAEYSQSGRWASLPKDVKYYLKYHRENMSHHHYAFKYDGSDFLRTTFVEIALNDSSAALLYAIVAFAAYHHSIARDDDKISSFLTFYNKSIAYLQQSLKNKRHNVATLLTILTLATVEEFLGDWVNLLGHQRAAYQILTDLFTPQTIMQDETRRQIINWYIRFDLFAGIMSGGETILDRAWFAAAADFYERQTRDRPKDLGAVLEKYFATTRLLATDVTLLFAGKKKNTISDDDFVAGIQRLSAQFAEFGNTIETAFTDPSCFVKDFSGAPPPSDNDLFDFRDPNFLYAGELAPMNFVLTDHWAVDLMFKYQTSLAMGQAPPAELTEIAMKKCKMFEAIQYGAEGGSSAVLGCQASLGIMALFLPKEPRYTMWCRRKFVDIERLGYIYQASYRKRMTDIWGEDMSHWWLPNDEGYLSTIRTVRDFVEYRATKPRDPWAVGIRDMSGIFRTLNIEEQGVSDDMRSAGTDGSTSP